MRRALPLLLALALVAGCGDSDEPSDRVGNTTTPAPATSTPLATATIPAATTSTPAAATTPGGRDSPYVVVTSLLGKPLPKEPGCTFAKRFVPNKRPPAYDGGLALTVTCARSEGYTPIGQIVNREGNKPTEITCRDTNRNELYCIYVPSSTVGLYFTGTDRAVVRRRLERLIEVVRPLPTGVTPISGAASP